MMKQRVVVLGASRYNFLDDNKEKIEGCKIHYVEQGFMNEKDSIGVIPQTAIMEYEQFEFLDQKNVPGVYDAELTVSLRGKRPTLKVVGFDYVAPFVLNALPPVKAAAN